MKILVIFYSYEGNTKLIAESIAQTVNADLLELKPKNEMKAKGLMKYLWGAKSAFMKTKPELISFDLNLQNYDLIFIGTPVWAWSYAPVFNSFFSCYKIANKKVALFCCHGGLKRNFFDKMKLPVKDNEIMGEIDFFDPKKHNTEKNIQKAKLWAEGIIKM